MKKRISLRFISFLLSLVILLGGFPVSAVSLGTIDNTADASECLTEDISLRDKFTKHYIDTDGSRYAVVFPEQVHYQKNDEWLEVDNSLILDTKGERYVSENEIFKADFSKYSNDSQLVSIEEGGYKLSWSIAFASDNSSSAMSATANASAMRIDSRAAVLDSVEDIGLAKTRDNMTNMGKTMSSIRYNGVFNESVDIRYSVLHGKVEEDIILNSANAISSYILTVNTNGLNAVGGEDGSVRFIKADGETVFNLDAPWMTDAALAVSHDIAVEVVQKGSVAYIIYTPDAEWLNAESRLYPVLIDPSFTSRTYTSNYEDTYVYENDDPMDSADLQQIIVGTYEDTEHYAYIRILNIPEAFFDYNLWEIDSVALELSLKAPAKSEAPALNLYAVTEAWDIEELCYDNQPDSVLRESNVEAQTLFLRNGYSFDLSNWILGYEEEEDTLEDYRDYGFMISCSDNGYAQLYSSEVSNARQRPVFIIEYSYYPNEGLEDGAVYSFKNVSSGKYMTVYGGGTAEGTNICQSGTTIPTLSETFRLEYDEDFECFLIRSLCSSNGYGSALTYSYYSMSSNPAGSTSGNVSLCSVDYEDSAWEDNQTWMILPQSGTNRFKIVSYRDPGLAVTSCGSAAGTSGGKTSSSSGNIFVSEFTGAANQLWKIESGGIQLNNAENIKTATTKDKKSEGANLGQFFCPVTEFGETVAWTTDNSNSAEVTSDGNVTTKKAGIANITATVTHTNGTTTAYSFKIYVVIQNGVYYFLNVETGYRIEYESPSDYSEGAVLEVYDNSYEDEGFDVPTYALFKIKYLGNGKYSIRSMLRNDMGWTVTGDSELVMTNIGTTDSQIEDTEKWNIAYDSNGYYIYYNFDLAIAATGASESNVICNDYAENEVDCHWTLTKITDSINGVAICDKVSVLPVGETSTLTSAVYSTNMYHNGQNGFTWSITSGSQYASINATTGVLTAVAPGSVTVKVAYKYTTWYATYTLRVVPIADGTYFFRNVKYDDRYMQINQNVSSDTDGAHMEIFSFDSGADQRWNVTHIGSGYYKIISYVSGYALTAPSQNNESITQTEYDPSNNAQKWIVTIVGDGSYKLSPLSDTSSYMAVSGSWGGENGRNVEKRADQSDGKDEWYLFCIDSAVTVNLNVVYDNAYLDRYTNAVNRINKQMIVLQEKYLSEYDVWIEYTSPTIFSSYADTHCSVSYDETCNHVVNSECYNSVIDDEGNIILESNHHNNIFNITLRIPLPDISSTLKVAYIGHDNCVTLRSDNGLFLQHIDNPYNGLTYPSLGLATIMNFISEESETKTLIHEFGHFYGVIDHYGGDAPTTDQIIAGSGNAGYNRKCIYGEDKEESEVLDSYIICDGCRDIILDNINLYDHN